MVETFFKTLKSELVWRTVFLTRAEAAASIGRSSTASTTPSDATRRWTSSARPRSRDRPLSKPTALH